MKERRKKIATEKQSRDAGRESGEARGTKGSRKLSRIKAESRSWRDLSEVFNVVLLVRRVMGDRRVFERAA